MFHTGLATSPFQCAVVSAAGKHKHGQTRTNITGLTCGHIHSRHPLPEKLRVTSSTVSSNMDAPVNVPVDDPNADTEWYGIKADSSVLESTF